MHKYSQLAKYHATAPANKQRIRSLFKISQVVILYVSDSVGNVSSVLENIDLLDRKKVIHHNCFVLAGN